MCNLVIKLKILMKENGAEIYHSKFFQNMQWLKVGVIILHSLLVMK